MCLRDADMTDSARVSNETLDVCVRRGVLSAANRNDPAAIEAAFYALCDVGLGVR